MAYGQSFYGSGGGGIPPQLQTDMDSVLNKKLGTSTSYPSTSWAKEVNLMGLLPEKTVSGAVASFPDGADDVPIKTATFDIAPSLDGVSAVNVVRSGKNLFDPDVYSSYEQSDGSYLGSATDFNSIYTYIPSALVGVELTFSAMIKIPTGSTLSNPRVAANVNGTNQHGNNVSSSDYTLSKVTFTPTSTSDYLKITYGSYGSQSVQFKDVQLEIGSAATAYEPYTTPTTRTISLGQTVYGGSVTVDEDGECDLDDTHNGIDLGSLSWSIHNNVAGRFMATLPKTAKGSGNYGVASGEICSGYSTINMNTLFNNTDGISIQPINGDYVFVYDSSKTSLTGEQFGEAVTGVKLTYEAATPTTSTLTPITPINTLLGVNNIWCDTGDVETLTYRAQAVIPVNVTIGVNKPTNSTSIAFSIVDVSQTLYSETITCDVYGAFTEKTINFTSQGRPVSMKIKGVRSSSADIPFFFIEWDGWSITFTANGNNSSYECNKTVNAIL